MAKIKDIIARVDANKFNEYSDETKLRLVAVLDGKIAVDVLLLHPSETGQFNYTYPEGLEMEPLVHFPHDDLYEKWLVAQIDLMNREYEDYQNHMEQFNAAYENFVNWLLTYHTPESYLGKDAGSTGGSPLYYITAYGLAVKQGFEGTLEEWLASLKGEKGDPGTFEDMTPEQIDMVAECALEKMLKEKLGFDSGELSSNTYGYSFHESEAQFVLVTIRGYQENSHTVVVDCLSLPEGASNYEYETHGYGGCLFVSRRDGIISMNLEDGPGDEAYIARVCGYKYGGSGGDSEALNEHIEDDSNPHNVTAEQIGALTHDELEAAIGPLIVTLSIDSEGDTRASHDPQQIQRSVEGGRNVYLEDYNRYIPLSIVDQFYTIFSTVEDDGIVSNYLINQDCIVLQWDRSFDETIAPMVVTLSEDGKTASHNPQQIARCIEVGGNVFLETGDDDNERIQLSYFEFGKPFFNAIHDDGLAVVYYINDDCSVHMDERDLKAQKGEPGKDGVSPTITVNTITGGHRITITDATGTKSFDVMDGIGTIIPATVE